MNSEYLKETYYLDYKSPLIQNLVKDFRHLSDVEKIEKLKEFRGLVRSNVPKARQALRKLLKDAEGNFSPIVIRPVERGANKTFVFEGQTTMGWLFNNVGAWETT